MMTGREEINDSKIWQKGSSNQAIFSPSSSLRTQSIDCDSECESVSGAEDVGDRSLRSSRNSGGNRLLLLSSDIENGAAVPFPKDASLSAAPANGVLQPVDEMNASFLLHIWENEDKIHWILEYVCCLMFLALLGDLGVLTRYYLQKLFGPRVLDATSDQYYMYPDVFSNIVGSFLMGWLGVVFKADISKLSNNLAIGLTTGFLGSLTTFSGWNQSLLQLSIEGRWVFSVLSIVIGLFLVAFSIIFGIETARGFKWLNRKWGTNLKVVGHDSRWILNQYLKYLTALLLFIFAIVLGVCIVFEIKEFNSTTSNAPLLLACIVGPFGVWIRWSLARCNGRGFGKSARLKWVPFGTLVANVLAASIMAALAILKLAIKRNACVTVATGIQLGFCGCLSTVSTFIAEFNAMRQSSHPWRAYAYFMGTIMISFALGTLIYSLPVWIKRYN